MIIVWNEYQHDSASFIFENKFIVGIDLATTRNITSPQEDIEITFSFSLQSIVKSNTR